MFLFVFDMFKVGVGFLLFYIIGLMVVGSMFLDYLCGFVFEVSWLCVILYGSLVFIGVGYVMDCVVILGFVGFWVDDYNVDKVEVELVCIVNEGIVMLEGFG